MTEQNKTLYLIRHGDCGVDKVYLGKKNISLSEKGNADIHHLKTDVEGLNLDTIWVSPLLRARESANILFPKKEYDSNIMNDLEEIDFGKWDGLTFEEVQKNWPDEVKEWANFNPEFSFPKGEYLKNFFKRVDRVYKNIVDSKEKNILIISHGGVIRALICKFLGLPQDKYVLFNVSTASLSSLSLFGSNGVLNLLNYKRNIS